MFNNIKLIGVIFLSILLLTNCKKENKDTQQPGELSFATIDVMNEKSDPIFDIECPEDVDLTVAMAEVILNNGSSSTTYFPATFIMDGKLYTQSIKLPAGTYTIEKFVLLNADGDIVKATPMAGSDYAGFVTAGIGALDPIIVEAYLKKEFSIDVLCYVEAAVAPFGFEWFVITEITVREQCFFGDFCIKDVKQYDGTYGPASLYNLNGVTIDEKAIFKIVAFRKVGADWVNINNVANPDGEEFYNFVNGDYVSPLCIEYADYDVPTDHFKFELWIYVTSGTSHDYVKFYEWEFDDDEKISAGDDGVVDFVLGNCAADYTDLLLPPWMNLPFGDAYTFNLSNGGFGGGNDYYWDITISGLSSPLYDMWNDVFPGWCADEGTTIGNSTYCMDAMSSLYPEKLPSYWLDAVTGGLTRTEAIAAANWLWNNEGDYDYTGVEMQDALWKLFNNKNVSGKALIMATDAMQHTSYSPLPGGWAAIFFVPCDSEPDQTLQMTFFVVDP